MVYLRLIHQSLSRAASFVNKAILVAGVLLAITGFFLHYYYKDVPHKTDTVSDVRTNVYQNIHSLKNNPDPKSKTTLAIFRFSTCSTLGEGCTDNPQDGDKNFSTSIFGSVTNLIALPYTNPPASGVAWLQDSFQNVGFVPHTYAAGVGFYSLSAFANIWKIFRNITFFIMALAIVVVGFLIMFRVKIDSQTVISLENSLPRIVITLLLITFSYAIAGFLIDLMYLLIMVIITLLGDVNQTGVHSVDITYLTSIYLTNQKSIFNAFVDNTQYMNAYIQGLYGLVEVIPWWIKGTLFGVIYSYLWTVGFRTLGGMLNQFIHSEVEGSIVVASLKVDWSQIITGLIIAEVLAYFVPILIGFIIPFLLAIIALLILFFRIFFMLLKAYVQIIINVIFAPILILPNVLPGNNSFMDWLKRLVGNLLAFPLTAILLITIQLISVNDEYLGFLDLGGSAQHIAPVQFSMPMMPFKTSQLVPIIAAVFLMIIPDWVKKVTDSIAGPSIFGEAGPGALISGISGAAGTVYSRYAGLATLNQAVGGRGPAGVIARMLGIKTPESVRPQDKPRESGEAPSPDVSST